MKKVILMMAFAIGMTGAYAQKTLKVEKTGNDTEETADSGETETTSKPSPCGGLAGCRPCAAAFCGASGRKGERACHSGWFLHTLWR